MIDRLRDTFRAFVRAEASGGLLLMACAAVALVWANTAFGDGYRALWQHPVTLGLGDAALTKPLLLWINDGLMAFFFLLVGLEIKREVVVGELSSLRQAALPLAGALGGMVLPAAVFVAINAGGAYLDGWAVPMATDIAFALGVILLLGSRVPPALKLFLVALAIVDDLGAVLVIALFYTETLATTPLLAAVALTAVLALLNRAGVRHLSPYAVLGVLLWVAVLKSGVHATVAGVVLALTIPLRDGRASAAEDTPLHRLEHFLHKPVAFVVLPVFALANAGVPFGGDASMAHPLALGVALGLLLGKPLGVAGFAYAAVRLGLASLPLGVRWRQVVGVSLLTGIGFTMSLFIAGLAFADAAVLDVARRGILAGSLGAGLAGAALLAVRSGAGAATETDAGAGAAA